MNAQIDEVLRTNGWQEKTWDGDRFFMKVGDNVFMTLSVSVKEVLVGYAINMDGGWGRIDINSVVQEIMIDEHFYPLEYKNFRLKTNNAPEAMEFGKESAAKLEELAKTFDFDKKLSELIAARPDRPVLRQVFHLAALAYSGNVAALDDYGRTFAKGHRLNFVPMISHDYIERALSIAYRKLGDSLANGSASEGGVVNG